MCVFWQWQVLLITLAFIEQSSRRIQSQEIGFSSFRVEIWFFVPILFQSPVRHRSIQTRLSARQSKRALDFPISCLDKARGSGKTHKLKKGFGWLTQLYVVHASLWQSHKRVPSSRQEGFRPQNRDFRSFRLFLEKISATQ